MSPIAWRLIRLDRASIALLTAVAVLATVVGVTVASPPDAVRPSDVDGRTWMSVPTGDGPGLVLLNGFSGLVEARARAGGELPRATRFAASGARSTVLAGDEGVVVVDDGLHDARAIHVPARGAVLVGDDVLVVDRDGRVTVQQPGEEPEPLDLGGDEVVAEPVLDGDGVAWFLAERTAGFRAWRVGADLDPSPRDVPGTTTALGLIDGEAVAITRTGAVAIDGGADRGAPAGAIVPVLAMGAGGTWAHAEGSRVTVDDDGDVSEVTLDDPVEELVVWGGVVLATTVDGAHRIAGGEAAPVGEFDAAPQVHTDGGLLWLTSRNRVTAVWDDQSEVTFELAAIDLDLCVGDCDAGDVRQFLDEQEEQDDAEEPATTTTTRPDRRSSTPTTRELRAPSVEPSIPTTTTTTTTTTVPATAAGAPGDETGTTATSRPRATTTSTTSTTQPPPTRQASPPPAAPTPPPPPPTTPTRPTLLPRPQPSDPGPGAGDPGPENPPWRPGPERPPWLPGRPGTSPSTTEAPPITEAPPTTSDPAPTTSTEPPTEPPRGSVGLVLSVERSAGSATATVAVQGRAVDCGAVLSRSANGTVSWSGAASGSQQVTLSWDSLGDSSSSTQQVTIADVGAGELTVTFSACGAQTSQTASDPDAPPPEGDPDTPPTVSAMSINPAQPQVGEPFTASVSVTNADGWSVSGARWTAGACGNERDVGGDGLSQTFTAEEPGRFCVSVIVTLAGPGDASDRQTAGGEVDVVETTTTSSSSTTTTSSTTSTSTTTTSTTTTSTTTSTSTTSTTSTTVAPTPTTGATDP